MKRMIHKKVDPEEVEKLLDNLRKLGYEPKSLNKAITILNQNWDAITEQEETRVIVLRGHPASLNKAERMLRCMMDVRVVHVRHDKDKLWISVVG